MITEKDIPNMEGFNIELIKEALRQTELKMQDENNKKLRIDQRAYILIPFIISSIAYITLKITDLPFDTIYKLSIVYAIYFALILLLISSIGVFFTLKPRLYASLGRTPDIWLRQDILTSQHEQTLGMILTKILLEYYYSIEQTDKINNKRIKYLKNSSVSFLSAWGVLLFSVVFINYPF
jgi:hypothetical protein